MTNASRKSKPKAASAVTRVAPSASPERSPATGKPPEDVVLVHGATDDGGFRVLRKRGDDLFVGEMRAIEEGKPLVPGGEVVSLRPRADSPQLFDAETLYRVPAGGLESGAHGAADGRREGHDESSAPAARASTDTPTTVGGGPAQVSTPAYREGWGAIFGARRRGGPHTLN